MGPFASYPSLHGRVVFISGGSSGIGAELVRAFAAQGSQLAFCGTKPEGGAALVAEISAAGYAQPYYSYCVTRVVLRLPDHSKGTVRDGRADGKPAAGADL